MSISSFRQLQRHIRTIPHLCQKSNFSQNIAEVTKHNIVWLDMEMTGLDINKHHILEVACLVTDRNLQIISKDFNVVIHQPEEVLSSMNDWCKDYFTKTRLLYDSIESKVTPEEAENSLLEFLEKYVPEKQCPLAGNTIYMDRIFLMKYMPRIHEYLHHRVIDVSSIKELVRRWKPSAMYREKTYKHRALSDIKESIEELKYYANTVFNENCVAYAPKENNRNKNM